MRVLVVSGPTLGHVFPMVPLQRALRAAGHDVLVGTAGDAMGVRQAGLSIEDVAPTFHFGRVARRMMMGHPLTARAELAGVGGTRGVSLLFGAVNEQMAAGVVALADRWKPDLVVYEPLAVAGALAAARCGVRAVLHENSLFDGPLLVQATAERMANVLRSHGMTGQPPMDAIVTVAPPSLVGARRGWPMRYVPYSGEGVLPDWLRRPPVRPRIAVSRSTVAGPGGGDIMSAVVAAAPNVDAEFVLVRPDRKVLRRKALPENIRTVAWIPLNSALLACAGIVHHGGAGGVLGALAAGVPQLVVPGPGDRRHNARLVAARGAGLAVAAKAITATELIRLITDTALASAAGEVRQEMAAMPGPVELVARLEALKV
jgi:UDP:flavonoid glycosyltransferase YjiC (YdhE family)